MQKFYKISCFVMGGIGLIALAVTLIVGATGISPTASKLGLYTVVGCLASDDGPDHSLPFCHTGRRQAALQNRCVPASCGSGGADGGVPCYRADHGEGKF